MLVRTVLAASIAVTVLGAGTVSAQQYPSKPVRIVVGFSAGGLADQIGRLFGDYIRRSTGQSGLVDNRGGVAGTIGMDQVAKAAPDGHTLGIVIALAGGFILYGALKFSLGLRLSEEQEFDGSDLTLHKITTPERDSGW